MQKDEFNSKFRSFVEEEISLTNCVNQNCGKCDRCYVTNIYDSLRSILNQSCIQIGSYPRATVIKPLHDLDILYIIGDWDKNDHSPESLLKELLGKLQDEYPDNDVSLQTHSITIIFERGDEEFSVDVVPAYIYLKSEDFKQDTYKVPEILMYRHGKDRTNFRTKFLEEERKMNWIHTDPRGYMEEGKLINQTNEDFRKTVKFIKAWRSSCKVKDDEFKLKSFHIEQVITKYYEEDSTLTIFDGIFKFFFNIPKIIESSQIENRIKEEANIDEYLNTISDQQRNRIIQARDCFLKRLENFSEEDATSDLIEACFYERKSDTDTFLFDLNIPTLIDTAYEFRIDGFVTHIDHKYGWISNITKKVVKDSKVEFEIKTDIEKDTSMWKVKNDNACKWSERRGEINERQTLNNPENVQYFGKHYVECYAIKDNICIARSKVKVII